MLSSRKGKGNGYLWKERWRERREYCSPVHVQSIKWSVFLCADSVNLQPINANWHQFIYQLLLKINTNPQPHKSSPSIGHWLSVGLDYQYRLVLIDIDCHRLSISSIGYAGDDGRNAWTLLCSYNHNVFYERKRKESFTNFRTRC